MESEASTRIQNTSISFGYRLDLPKANPFSKVPWTAIGSWVPREKQLPPLPLPLALRAFLNRRKDQFQCGFGLTMG